MTENEFQAQIIDLAHCYGWRCAHFRSVPVRRKDGSYYYQTPVQADGAGFPDLVLCKGKRLIFAELKSPRGVLSDAQRDWMAALMETGAEWYVWKPCDFDMIHSILGGKE